MESGPRKGQIRFPEDRASGVGILLSKRAQSKLLDFGSQGERVCYVRLQGPVCNLFVIAVYIPHRGRTSPCQDDTLKDLEAVLSQVPKSDCVCIAGDFNEQVEAGIQHRTGRWTAGPASQNAGKIMQLMQLHELTAVNTLFKPRHPFALNTFLQTMRKENADSDQGEYVGRKVRVKYRSKWCEGNVVATKAIDGKQNWIVKFRDGYIKHYNDRRELEEKMVFRQSPQMGRQLDYILVSTRWKSCVRNCKVKWRPSMHRDRHGHRNDHGLVECSWKWRIRATKRTTVKDFGGLYVQEVDEEGKPIENKLLTAFEEAMEEKLQDLKFSKTENAALIFEKMQAAIHFAVETVLPTKVKTRRIRREVSEKTKSLFEKRTGMNGSEQEFKHIQAEIAASSLGDFKSWVTKWADYMGEANGRGDVQKIYEGVKALAEKSEKPPSNLATDSTGNTLGCATDVAEAWFKFLSKKFAATEIERNERPAMEPLPCTKNNGDELTVDQICKGLAKMGNGKACGLDGIPAELYKRSKLCKGLLICLLQTIWRDEDVPSEFARATFVMLFKNKGSTNDPSKYRCIGLLNHCYKVLAQCLLERLEKETGSYLSDWQADFRKK